ncbi:MAG TPA: VCBS repeat-containing protein [Ktedonobacteraceae bacterium]|nr:VCBS repeat-containing protein [Ktedonobacteraceae bacterium]
MSAYADAYTDPPPPRRQAVYLPADVLDEEDDALSTRRAPSSVRRYATTFPTSTPPRVAIRVTRHQGPPPIQRASRLAAAATQPAARPKALWRPHWLASVGLGMLATLMLAGILSPLWHWWQGQQDGWQYGYPRTFQCDQDVRHGGVSHFLAENLHGHIIVLEMQPSDLARTRLYQGPTLLGPQADLHPVTLTFEDVNGDGYPDLLITVNEQRYVFINDQTAFRPATPADTIKEGGA